MSRYAERETDMRGRGGGSAVQRAQSGTPGKRTLTEGLPPSTASGAGAATAGGSLPLVDREPAGATASQHTGTTGGSSGTEVPTPGAPSPGTMTDAPSATYIIPFDRAPLAAPGERIIFNALFTGGTPTDYELVYSTVGGHFTTASGPTTRTIQGLSSGNVDFFVPSPWNGTDAVSVTMQLKKKADSSVVQTETWNIGKKVYYPTSMTQKETTGERNLPGVYSYDIGPARSSGSKPFYEHQTILERFENWSIRNIAPTDIQEAYRTANGLTSAAAITSHFIGSYAGNNGTFTVDSNDQIFDQHGGHPNVDNLVTNLTTPKDIEIALPQIYEAQPSTALGRYTITRVRKVDGSWKVKKGTSGGGGGGGGGGAHER
jgi:hypothetical protein